MLELTEADAAFRLPGVDAAPVLSLLRGFSAPVKLDAGPGRGRARLLMAHDRRPVQPLGSRPGLACDVCWHSADGAASAAGEALDDAPRRGVAARLDEPPRSGVHGPGAVACPRRPTSASRWPTIDVDGVHAAREACPRALGGRLRGRWLAAYRAAERRATFSARRRPRWAAGRCATWRWLSGRGRRRGEPAACAGPVRDADNMTDSLAALELLAEGEPAERAQALADFYARWRDDAAGGRQVVRAAGHGASEERGGRGGPACSAIQAFTWSNPNRVRALIGAFAGGNLTGFHRADGRAIALVADHVLELDPRNPQVASRLAKAFDRWRRYDAAAPGKMRAQLERILAAPKLSRDVYEIASKSLA